MIGRGAIEHKSGGAKSDTKDLVGELITRLHAIWYASRFGAFDSRRRVIDPYFAGATPRDPRLSFAAAAQHYGRIELRRRFPDVGERTLGALLSWPLTLLSRLLDRLR